MSIKQAVKLWLRRKASAVLPVFPEQNTSVQQAILVNQYHMMKHLLPPSAMPKQNQTGFKVYSQFEEDGLLLYIFSVVGAESKRVVEICAGDGKESMAANLLINHGWEGLLFDGNPDGVRQGREFFAAHDRTWHRPPTFVHAWITTENINALVSDNGLGGDIDLLSLDIDGNDYWILKALNVISPRVILCETQNAVPADRALTQPYDEHFHLDAEKLELGFFSASMAAMQKFCAAKGYRLIGTHRYGFNAIFMRNDVGKEFFPEVSVESVLDNPYSRSTREKKWPKASSMPWVEV